MQDDHFEWDDDKAESNLAKHEIAFETARMVFEDELGVDLDEQLYHDDEDRWLRVGLVGSRLVAVVYTFRDSRIRVISARKPTPREARQYHEAEDEE